MPGVVESPADVHWAQHELKISSRDDDASLAKHVLPNILKTCVSDLNLSTAHACESVICHVVEDCVAAFKRFHDAFDWQYNSAKNRYLSSE